MAEVDPVILQLRAEVDRYQADVRRATRTVDQQLGTQERRVKQLENQFRSSSGAISTSLKGLAGTLATAFTGRELVGLIDSFTRLQNNLKVAGLEGEGLAAVQERLRSTAARYGVELETLSSVYQKAALVQNDLGASTEEILRLNEITAAALKVTGSSAAEAQGALLQLGQALGSGVVRAEEFNSILEGALPLAQAAARGIEGYGGSVAKLRAAIADGKITSQQFFQGVLRGGTQTLADADKATLTLSGAFTALRNELTVYVGEAATANGVTEALASGIQALADNLDTIIPALATIAAAVGIRLVAGYGAATLASVALSAALAGNAVQMGIVGSASFALQARLAGAATSMEALAFAARGAGASLLAAFGGPVGLAIGAVAIGLVLVATSARGADAATGEYKRTLEDARKASDNAREAAERLASAHGQTRVEALRAAEAERELTKQKLAGARASLVQAQAELKKAAAFQKAQNVASVGGGVPGTGAFIQGRGDTRVATASSNVAAAEERIKNLEGAIATLDAAIVGTSTPTISAGGDDKKKKTPKGRQGPSAADIELRFRDELDSIRIRINQAEGERARTAQERAEFEGRQLEIAEDVALRSLAADQDYTEAQKAIVRERLIALGEAERDNIAFRERAQLEREALDLADERGRAQTDALRLQFDLADTEAERRRIALQILDAENELLRSRLEAILASDTAAEIDRERARVALAALDAQEPAQRASVERQFEGPLQRFARNTKDTDTRVAEAAVRRIEELNQTITDAMTNALGIKDPFLSQLIKIFLDKNVFGPLAEALSSQGGGGGGLFGSLLQIGSSLFGGGRGPGGEVIKFGRSSGGFVQAGRPYRVNEGSSPGRVEAFVPNTNGQIIPLGRMNAMQSGTGGGAGGLVKIVIEEGPGFASRVRTEATGVAIEVTRQAAPQIVDAAANETLRRANRPSL